MVKEIKQNSLVEGSSHRERPKNPPDLTDDQWAEYLFLRKNEKGLHYERWNHEFGCRQWFNLARNTATDEILAIYKIGENPPKLNVNAPITPSGEAKLLVLEIYQLQEKIVIINEAFPK